MGQTLVKEQRLRDLRQEQRQVETRQQKLKKELEQRITISNMAIETHQLDCAPAIKDRVISKIESNQKPDGRRVVVKLVEKSWANPTELIEIGQYQNEQELERVRKAKQASLKQMKARSRERKLK